MLVAIYEGGIMGVVSLIGGVSGPFLGVVSFDGRSAFGTKVERIWNKRRGEGWRCQSFRVCHVTVM